jgi:hypothetical protein
MREVQSNRRESRQTLAAADRAICSTQREEKSREHTHLEQSSIHTVYLAWFSSFDVVMSWGQVEIMIGHGLRRLASAATFSARRVATPALRPLQVTRLFIRVF